MDRGATNSNATYRVVADKLIITVPANINLIGVDSTTTPNKKMIGDYYSLIVFNRILSAGERAKVEASLNQIFSIY